MWYYLYCQSVEFVPTKSKHIAQITLSIARIYLLHLVSLAQLDQITALLTIQCNLMKLQMKCVKGQHHLIAGHLRILEIPRQTED